MYCVINDKRVCVGDWVTWKPVDIYYRVIRITKTHFFLLHECREYDYIISDFEGDEFKVKAGRITKLKRLLK